MPEQEATQETAAKAPAAEQPQAGPDELRVKIWSPFKVYYDGAAKSVSAVNGTGPFDILPKHHNFITLLNACDMGLVTNDGKIKVRITGGVMHVHRNTVTIFLEV